MTAPRQSRRTIGSQGHLQPVLHRGKRSHGVKWLSNSIYCVLGLMVLHLMTSQGDAPQIPGSRLRGRTTKKTKPESLTEDVGRNKKLPSYRKPEHYKDIQSDATLFETIPHQDDPRGGAAVSAKTTTTATRRKEQEASLTRQKKNSESDSHNNSYNKLGNNSSNAYEETADRQNNEELQTAAGGEGEEENNNDKYNNINNENSDNDNDNDNDRDDEEKDIADNVGALKASVDDILLRLRFATQVKMLEGMGELQPDLQDQKSRISTILSILSKETFPGDTALKVKEYVYELLEENIAMQFQEQLDLLLTQASDDIDLVVAEYEEKELDVIEMDHRLADFERERRPLIEEDVQSITNSLKGQLQYTVPDVAKEALENLFPLMSLEFDDYGRLKMDPSSAKGILLTEKEILAAIESARADASEDEGSEDAVKTKQNTSHHDGDYKQDSQNGDGGDEDEGEKEDTDHEKSVTTFRTSTASRVRGQKPKAHEEPREYNAGGANKGEDDTNTNDNEGGMGSHATWVSKKRIQTFDNIATNSIGEGTPLDGTGNANEEQANDNEESGDDDDDEAEEDKSAIEMSAVSNATMSDATERLNRKRTNGLSGAFGTSNRHKTGLAEDGFELASKNHYDIASNVGGSNYHRPKVKMENENAGLSNANYGPGRMGHANKSIHNDNEGEELGEVKATRVEEQEDNEDESEGEGKANIGEEQGDSGTASINPIFNNEQPKEEDEEDEEDEEKKDAAFMNPSEATQTQSNDTEGANSNDGTTTQYGRLPKASEAEDEDSGGDINGANRANLANPSVKPIPVADTNGGGGSGGNDDDETEDT